MTVITITTIGFKEVRVMSDVGRGKKSGLSVSPYTLA
jgi:hypothetical protein